VYDATIEQSFANKIKLFIKNTTLILILKIVITFQNFIISTFSYLYTQTCFRIYKQIEPINGVTQLFNSSFVFFFEQKEILLIQ